MSELVEDWMRDTVNSRLADNTRYYGQNPALHPAKAINRCLTESDSHFCGLSLLRTPNYGPRVSAITRVDCSLKGFLEGYIAVTSNFGNKTKRVCFDFSFAELNDWLKLKYRTATNQNKCVLQTANQRQKQTFISIVIWLFPRFWWWWYFELLPSSGLFALRWVE